MASSSSSSAAHPLKYDVFLNFRGKDTRRGFISHLCAALHRKGLQIFFDDDDLKRGEEIAPSLLHAIQDSTVAILVFSKNYAFSRWCLDELAEIMECHSHGQIVVPIFYKVDPSHLRHQGYDVAAAFVKHEQNPMNAHNILRWRNALTKAANLSGFDSNKFRNDDLLINKIVEDILEKLNKSMPCDDFEHLDKTDSGIKEIKEVFTINPSETPILGIWEMGVIGKTITNEVLYKMMFRRFQDCGFADNVRQQAEASGINNLQEELILKYVLKTNGQMPSEDEEVSSHQRLLERLQVYGLAENKVERDGNCQFRALSDQLYRSPEYHKLVRKQIVNQLRTHREMYEGYVPMAFSEYLMKMKKSGEWGDYVTLQAAADSYGIKIFVITSFKDTCYIEILPHSQKSKREIPLMDTRKKKKWWMLGS